MFAVLVGCGAPPARVPITVVVRGDTVEAARAQSALRNENLQGVELRWAELDAPLVEPRGPDVAAALDRVRAAYDEPSWQKCIAPIEDSSLVPALLAAGRRDDASRVLFWRAACLLLKGDVAGAKAAARELAARELDVPNEKSDPAVQRLVADAALDASRAKGAVVHVVSAGPELAVSFDGRRAICTTPCPIVARPGPHSVRVEGDGRSPQDRELAVEAAPVELRFDPPPAPPDLAARQWVSRWASSPAVDGAPSLHLLADATRARDLVLVVAQGGAHPDLRAALVADGVVRARAEKDGARGDAAPALVHELLVTGHVVESASIFAKPLFWIGIAAAAGLAVGLTYYFATLPHTARLSFPP